MKILNFKIVWGKSKVKVGKAPERLKFKSDYSLPDNFILGMTNSKKGN